MWEEKRESKRITLSLPIDYVALDSESKELDSTICKNISEGGLKVVFKKFYPPRSKFLVRINLTGMNRIIETIAESVWSFNMQFANTYYNGLRFVDLNLPARKKLKEYLTLKEIMRST
jgi:c-di-GMP-binding flagellar brake protein YcgR